MIEHLNTPMNIYILLTLPRVRVLILETRCAAQHGQYDREGVLRVIKRDVKDGARVDCGVNGGVVVCTCEIIVKIQEARVKDEDEGMNRWMEPNLSSVDDLACLLLSWGTLMTTSLLNSLFL